MMRLAALACGLLCGAGFLISGLYDPMLAHDVGARENGPLAFSLAIFTIVVVAGGVAALARADQTPVLGGVQSPAPDMNSRTSRVSALVFGIGWGVSGYFPLAAFVSAAALSPGAVVFLASVLFGMIFTDVATGQRSLGARRSGSFG